MLLMSLTIALLMALGAVPAFANHGGGGGGGAGGSTIAPVISNFNAPTIVVAPTIAPTTVSQPVSQPVQFD